MNHNDLMYVIKDYLSKNGKKSIVDNELYVRIENIKPIDSEINNTYTILVSSDPTFNLIEDHEVSRFRFSIIYKVETEEIVPGWNSFDYAEITHYFYEIDNRVEIIVNGSFDRVTFNGNVNTNLRRTDNIIDLIDFTDVGYSQYLDEFVFPVLLRDMNEVQFNWIKDNLFIS
jgi:hypothetical protein